MKFLGLECPVVKRGFILVNEKLNEPCRRFVNYMLDEFECVKIISLDNIMVQAWLITESINCRIIKNLFGNFYLVLKTEQLDSFLLYLENVRDDSEFFNSFYDIFYNKILKVENKSDAVSADFLCDETVGISNLDDVDQLLIDKGSLGINNNRSNCM